MIGSERTAEGCCRRLSVASLGRCGHGKADLHTSGIRQSVPRKVHGPRSRYVTCHVEAACLSCVIAREWKRDQARWRTGSAHLKPRSDGSHVQLRISALRIARGLPRRGSHHRVFPMRTPVGLPRHPSLDANVACQRLLRWTRLAVLPDHHQHASPTTPLGHTCRCRFRPFVSLRDVLDISACDLVCAARFAGRLCLCHSPLHSTTLYQLLAISR